MKKIILIVLVMFGLTVGATAQPYAFGHQPKLGGFVFSITADHLHGVVAETQDQANYCKWNDVNNHINLPENHSYYGRKYSDWRLPTKYELALIYDYRETIGGFFGDYYWSSTVPDWATGGAWWQRFTDGVQYVYTKENTFRVRAVRDF